MKKIVLIFIINIMLYQLLTVSAANDYAVITINGSTSTVCDGLAIVEVNANTQIGVKNIKGLIMISLCWRFLMLKCQII